MAAHFEKASENAEKQRCLIVSVVFCNIKRNNRSGYILFKNHFHNIFFITLCANTTGTALPICLSAAVRLPQNNSHPEMTANVLLPEL